ncbi:hypothetical protein V1264_016384 [Littorina saxatilis]|uniref:Uncharacterized protein n=1 Tax=Littorina saxatilis TaxID=31220 RepID=A0AAN9BPA4_9CAEN
MAVSQQPKTAVSQQPGMAVSQQPASNQQLIVPLEGVRNFSTGLCGCLSSPCAMIGTCCFLPCMMCRLADRMGECCCMPYCVHCYCFGCLIPMRTKVRTMGGIRGTICQDCLASCFCCPCVICQLSREMDNMGL